MADFDENLRAWGALWGVPDLATGVRITPSGRLRRALARCTPSTGSIRLNPGLLDAGPEILREVVCHEAAHVAAWRLHGRRAPHGREWAELMGKAGYPPRVRWPDELVPESIRSRPAPARRPMRAWRCRRCLAVGRPGLLEIALRVLAGR